jgi:hypothetical protein
MPIGILKRGFIINSNVHTVKIPKNTGVIFAGGPEPKIIFQGVPCKLLKIGESWFAEVAGCLMLVKYDLNHPPYPISFFERKPMVKA